MVKYFRAFILIASFLQLTSAALGEGTANRVQVGEWVILPYLWPHYHGNHIYLTGFFKLSISVDLGGTSTTLNSKGNKEILLLKF